jgi:hypothetical protein
MIDLLVASTIMRSKFKINCLNLVSCTCGWFLSLIISHLCIKTLKHSISWSHLRLTNRSWDRNSLIMLLFEFGSHDRFVSHKNNHEIKIRNNACLGFDLMIKVWTSWSILLDEFDLMNKYNFDLMRSKIRSHEKVEFWSHEIRPHDHFP